MIQKLAIVGVGLIGGSIGLGAREKKLAREIVGVETNPHMRAEATTRRAVEKCTDMLGIGIAGADVIVLAAPVPAILTDLARLGTSISEKTVITDVGSVKIPVAAAGGALGSGFVGGHPMAGSEKSGMENARPDLFEGATWVLTPGSATRASAIEAVTELAVGLGARVVTMTPEEHDARVAVTSHLPHLLAYALSATAAQRGGASLKPLEGPSFQSAVRVAAANPELWRDICHLNRAALGDALDVCISELDAMLKALDTADAATLHDLFVKGHR